MDVRQRSRLVSLLKQLAPEVKPLFWSDSVFIPIDDFDLEIHLEGDLWVAHLYAGGLKYWSCTSTALTRGFLYQIKSYVTHMSYLISENTEDLLQEVLRYLESEHQISLQEDQRPFLSDLEYQILGEGSLSRWHSPTHHVYAYNTDRGLPFLLFNADDDSLVVSVEGSLSELKASLDMGASLCEKFGN